MSGDTLCGARHPSNASAVPCCKAQGHAGDHWSTTGCAGSELTWASGRHDCAATAAIDRLLHYCDLELARRQVQIGADPRDVTGVVPIRVVRKIVREVQSNG